jgi:hypothetical protein
MKVKKPNKFFDLCTVGSIITTFGASMALFIELQFTYINNQQIPLSPLFIIPGVILIAGIVMMYIGRD